MKKYRQIAAIVTGVAAIFIAAELMPVVISRSTDKKTLGQTITMTEKTATAGIAYEPSYADKLSLLSDATEHTCTKVYHTDSLDELKKYDSKVLDTLWDVIGSFNQISAISRREENEAADIPKEADPVYIRLNRTDDQAAEQYFDEASCVSVGQSRNSMGTMTLWLLTFRQEENVWQFLLDTAEKRLYAVSETDAEKDGSGYFILNKKKTGMQPVSAAQYFRELCQLQMAMYYSGESAYDDMMGNDDVLLIKGLTDADEAYEEYVPFASSCQLLNSDTNSGLSLKYGIGSTAFYSSVNAAVSEYRLLETQEISYDIHLETEEIQ